MTCACLPGARASAKQSTSAALLLSSRNSASQQQCSRYSHRYSLLAPCFAGVSLLDPVKAAKESQQRNNQQQRRQQQQQQLDDVIAANPALQTLSNDMNPLVARCMAKLGYYEPTPIQSAAWPAAAAGKDLQGIAEPGSGKTLAYLLPAFARLASNDTSSAANGSSSGIEVVQPQMLVLAPSRELAQQVYNNCKSLFAVTALSTCCVFGGAPKDQQVTKLQQRQPAVLVATPGRLLDLVDSGVIGLERVRVVVLDEADKMLSVGFEPQLQRLKGLLLDNRVTSAQQLQQQPVKKKHKKQKREAGPAAVDGGNLRPQVLLFTATFPAAVQLTAEGWLQPDAVKVTVRAGADSISRTITQVSTGTATLTYFLVSWLRVFSAGLLVSLNPLHVTTYDTSASTAAVQCVGTLRYQLPSCRAQ